MRRKIRISTKLPVGEGILTIEEVSKYLKISRFTVYRMIKEKSIPATRLGGQWRFNRNEIDRWFLNQCITKPEYSFAEPPAIHLG